MNIFCLLPQTAVAALMALFKAEGGQLTTRNKDVFAWKASCTLREMAGRHMLEFTELDVFESYLASNHTLH